MGSFRRITRYIKDFWKVVVRGENDDLQRQTLSMQEELARLRNRRMASDKAREAAALNQARGAVQKLRELHDSLLAAEQAASEFAAKMGEAAKSSIEVHAETQEQAYKKFFTNQKHLYEKEIKSALQGDTDVPVSELSSISNEQDEARKLPELKTSGAVDDKDIIFAAMGGNRSNKAGRSEICSPDAESDKVGQSEVCPVAEGGIGEEIGRTERCSLVVEGGVEIGSEERRKPLVSPGQEDAAISSSSRNDAAVDEIMDIPPNILAQMMEEAKKQVCLEEKLQLDALARNKAILEKEIEARENAEHASMNQGQQ